MKYVGSRRARALATTGLLVAVALLAFGLVPGEGAEAAKRPPLKTLWAVVNVDGTLDRSAAGEGSTGEVYVLRLIDGDFDPTTRQVDVLTRRNGTEIVDNRFQLVVHC